MQGLWGEPWEMRPGEGLLHYYPLLAGGEGGGPESRPCPPSPTQARPGSRVNPW